jgi:AraC-like DNA-binding protein
VILAVLVLGVVALVVTVAIRWGCPAGHLTHGVRRKSGRTVQQWIGERRMQETRGLLTESDVTVATVIRRVGYPDVSYFIRRFHRDHGSAPLPRGAGQPASDPDPAGSWPRDGRRRCGNVQDYAGVRGRVAGIRRP